MYDVVITNYYFQLPCAQNLGFSSPLCMRSFRQFVSEETYKYLYSLFSEIFQFTSYKITEFLIRRL